MNARRTSLVALAVCVLALTAGRAQQARDQMQTPRTGAAAISGVIVTDESTPQPVKRAQVVVVNAEAGFTKTTFTSDAGRFSLVGLPAGRYTLMASKQPFLRASYGARRYDRPGTPITLAEGAQMTGVTLRLTRGSVLGGTITDENGQPAFGVSVRIMQMRVVNGERTFVNVPTGNVMGETTDDRGMYRFYGLPPGEYGVAATPRLAGEVRAMTDAEIRAVMQALQQQTTAAQQSRQASGIGGATPTATPTPAPKAETETVTVGYAHVFYPGTTVPTSAATVSVGPGEERTGVDFSLKLIRTARIEGVVSTPPGIRPQGVQLLLTPVGSTEQSAPAFDLFTINRAAPDAEGKFAFTAVPPGQYTIVARASALAPGVPPPPPPPPPGGGRGAGAGVIQFETFRTAPVGGEPMAVLPQIGLGNAGGPMYWGQTDVSVDGTAVSGITVSLQPGMTISGRVQFKGTRLVPDPDLSQVRLMLANVPTPGGARIATSTPMSAVEQNGQFRITGLTPGRYRVSGFAPLPQGSAPGPGWTMASAIVKGRDVLDFPLDIGPNDEINDAVVTFTDATQEVNGSLQDATGRPAPDYTIIVFAADNRFWTTPSRRIRSTRPGTDGRFTVTNLPPGEYRIAAVVDVAPNEINDPAFLEQLVGASVKFTLAEGERKAQDLRIAGGL